MTKMQRNSFPLYMSVPAYVGNLFTLNFVC